MPTVGEESSQSHRSRERRQLLKLIECGVKTEHSEITRSMDGWRRTAVHSTQHIMYCDLAHVVYPTPSPRSRDQLAARVLSTYVISRNRHGHTTRTREHVETTKESGDRTVTPGPQKITGNKPHHSQRRRGEEVILRSTHCGGLRT